MGFWASLSDLRDTIIPCRSCLGVPCSTALTEQCHHPLLTAAMSNSTGWVRPPSHTDQGYKLWCSTQLPSSPCHALSSSGISILGHHNVSHPLHCLTHNGDSEPVCCLCSMKMLGGQSILETAQNVRTSNIHTYILIDPDSSNGIQEGIKERKCKKHTRTQL